MGAPLPRVFQFARVRWAEASSSLTPALLVPLRNDVDCGPKCWATSVLFPPSRGSPPYLQNLYPNRDQDLHSHFPEGKYSFRLAHDTAWSDGPVVQSPTINPAYGSRPKIGSARGWCGMVFGRSHPWASTLTAMAAPGAEGRASNRAITLLLRP